MTIEERRAALTAELYRWQQFSEHPCWQEWRAGLEISLAEADTALHTANPRDPVQVAIAITQHGALRAFIEQPQERIADLSAALTKIEKGAQASTWQTKTK